MKTNRLLSSLAALTLLAGLAPAQTTWINQTLADPSQYLSWTDAANWSTATVPNGTTAVAKFVDNSPYYNGGPIPNRVQILNTAVTLDQLQYERISPANYSSYYPTLIVGGTAAGDRGSLEFTGTGMVLASYPPYYSSQYPGILLHNARLVFSNQAQVALSTNISTGTGTSQVWFRDDSIGTGLNFTLGGGSRLDFTDRARLQGSTVNITATGAHVAFSGSSSFYSSGLTITGPGLVDFSGAATVTNPYISFNRQAPANDSIVRFSGNARVQNGSATSYYASGVIEFTDQANADNFNINYVRQLDITGATTGTGTTGRQRAATGAPAATSVVADDARTVVLGVVSVEDLLLGSNTALVRGGNLRFISDTGGAYLSAAGANLTGGGLIMAGSYSNSLYLLATNAANPYAVPLDIQYGTVYTERPKLGAVTVGSAGGLTLRAGTSGSIVNNGNVTVAAATYRVNGNYTQTATGTLAFSMPYSSSNVPLLEVTGQATLDGTLYVPAYYNYFVGSRRSPIFRAGSITGGFANATNIRLSPMLSIGAEYAGNEIYLAYTQRPFVNAGATASQQSLGAHLDTILGNATGDLYNLVLRLNTQQDPAIIAAGLGQLAPDRYGVLNEQGFAAAAARQSALDRHVARLRDQSAADGFGLLVEGGRQQTRFVALDGLPDVSFRSSGGMAGVTWRQGRWSAGFVVGRDSARADLDGIGSHARIQSTAPGVFAQYTKGRFFIQGAASRSRDDYTLLRNSGIITRPSVVAAAPSGHRTDLAVTAGATLERNSWTLAPYAGILSSQVELDDFNESRVSGSGGTELAFTRWSVGSLRTRAGFDLTRTTGRLTPRFSLVWLHELEKERGLSAGLLAAGGARYRAPGRPAEPDLVQASFGVDWHINRRLAFSVNAGLAQGKNSDTTSDFSAGFRWTF